MAVFLLESFCPYASELSPEPISEPSSEPSSGQTLPTPFLVVLFRMIFKLELVIPIGDKLLFGRIMKASFSESLRKTDKVLLKKIIITSIP